MPVPYQPDGYRAVNPYLVVPDGERTLKFLKDVFGARELQVSRDPARGIAHASLAIGDGTLMLSQAYGPFPAMPAWLYIYVPDVDATYRKALAAGATAVDPPADKPYGDRGAGVRDQDGITWWMGTLIGRR